MTDPLFCPECGREAVLVKEKFRAVCGHIASVAKLAESRGSYFVRTPLRPVRVTARCGCGGIYAWNGIENFAGKNVHRCDRCGRYATFGEQYPRIEYEDA